MVIEIDIAVSGLVWIDNGCQTFGEEMTRILMMNLVRSVLFTYMPAFTRFLIADFCIQFIALVISNQIRNIILCHITELFSIIPTYCTHCSENIKMSLEFSFQALQTQTHAWSTCNRTKTKDFGTVLI